MPQNETGGTSPEIILGQDGSTLAMRNVYRGCSAFLIGGGPSFSQVDTSLLAAPGCLTMGMNNAAKSFRPDLWVCVDDPANFIRSIWLDPKITKFTPLAHAGKPLFDSDRWEFLDRTVADCPNVFYYQRNNRFAHNEFLTSETVNWGCDRNRGGGRSVMLVALRLLYHLGVREVFLLGVDFRMDKEHAYHFEQGRKRVVAEHNNKTYTKLEERFRLLRPVFGEAGFKVYNCNPASGLKAFPQLPLEEAVSKCREGLPANLASERTDGLYDQRKPRPPKMGRKPNRRQKNRQNSQPRPRPTVLEPASGGGSGADESSWEVVVGSDAEAEWLLPWWFGNYSRHNETPVTFVDFGMSPEMCRWCRERGELATLPPDLPRLPKAWFYKPAMFAACRADKILAVDSDCEVRGSLSPVFGMIGGHPLAARDPHVFKRYRNRFDATCYFNTGVVGAPRGHPTILEWGRRALTDHGEFRGDQEIFNDVLISTPGAAVTELPERFNRLRLNGDDPSAVVMHWTGDAGKAEIKKQIAATRPG